MLVMHYTGMKSGEEALERLCAPESQVSSHYLVEEDGRVFQLVHEDKRAWHAGVGSWRGETDINSASIGIEIVNPGHEFGYKAFPEAQMRAVILLAKAILERHAIDPFNVIGHSDLAPERKSDPGERFDWQRLAENGVGVWPESAIDASVTEEQYYHALTDIGYEGDSSKEALTRAFQRHWRQNSVTGIADAETRSRAIAVQNHIRRLT